MGILGPDFDTDFEAWIQHVGITVPEAAAALGFSDEEVESLITGVSHLNSLISVSPALSLRFAMSAIEAGVPPMNVETVGRNGELAIRLAAAAVERGLSPWKKKTDDGPSPHSTIM